VPNRSWRESVACAWRGLRWAVCMQRNLRLQLLIGVLVLSFGLIGSLDGLRLALLLLTILVVLALELANTALETLLDALYPHMHPVAARVKDVAAGAVLLAAVGSVGVGVGVVWGAVGTWFDPVARIGLMGLMGIFLYLAFPKPGSG